jgi:putative tricarboxylic transport membrane protein
MLVAVSRTSHHPRPRSRSGARRRVVAAAATALALLVGTGACGVTRGSDDPSNRRLQMMIPNSPGGGYDLTGRAAAQAMEDNDLTGRFEITNVLGASGTVAMQRLANSEGADDLVMTMGLGVVGAVYTNESDARVSDMTPVARLVEEQEGLLVPADSPYETVDDLVQAWKADPGSVTVGGGSSPGGPDHLFPMQLAQAVGIDPREVSYVSYDGGGPLTTALLGEKIDVGTSGLGEFEGQIADGSLRVLAVSGEDRLETVDAPTLTEEGVDLVFTNWRGVLAPPGISDEQLDYLVELLTEMHGTDEWQQALADNGWIDNFATGEEFATFLDEQDRRVEDTLKELGLA